MPNDKPSIFYVFLSRKFWMSILSMLVAVGVLSFSDAEQAEMVSLIVGGLGAVYTLAVALEDGLTKHNSNTTTVTTPSENVEISTSETANPVIGRVVRRG